MRVLFRLDASTRLGLGHFSRCRLLAGWLNAAGADCRFAMNPPPGGVAESLRSDGIGLHVLPGDADNFQPQPDAQALVRLLQRDRSLPDVLVIDHYGIDRDWEQVLRPHVGRILVIDDLADRPHEADALCDVNLVPDFESRYDGRLPVHCRPFLGPDYLLLREEFVRESFQARVRNRLQRVLVAYGGSDPTGETDKAIHALNDCGLAVDLVLGPSVRDAERLAACAEKRGFRIHRPAGDLARLCQEADLAFGAGGTMLWERAVLGLPSIVTVTADNQRDVCRLAADREALTLAGEWPDTDPNSLRSILEDFRRNPEALARYSRAAFALVPRPRCGRDHPLVEWILGYWGQRPQSAR